MKRYPLKSAAFLLSFIMVIFLFNRHSSAEIYRWVDENGVTHFSDRRPTGQDSGKEQAVDPSKTGTLSTVEGSEAAPTHPPEFISQEPGSEVKQELNRNASVVIYTVAT